MNCGQLFQLFVNECCLEKYGGNMAGYDEYSDTKEWYFHHCQKFVCYFQSCFCFFVHCILYLSFVLVY